MPAPDSACSTRLNRRNPAVEGPGVNRAWDFRRVHEGPSPLHLGLALGRASPTARSRRPARTQRRDRTAVTLGDREGLWRSGSCLAIDVLDVLGGLVEQFDDFDEPIIQTAEELDQYEQGLRRRAQLVAHVTDRLRDAVKLPPHPGHLALHGGQRTELVLHLAEVALGVGRADPPSSRGAHRVPSSGGRRSRSLVGYGVSILMIRSSGCCRTRRSTGRCSCRPKVR